jgi:hypothetical protein
MPILPRKHPDFHFIALAESYLVTLILIESTALTKVLNIGNRHYQKLD